jgi:hypothetical protein
LWIIKKRIREVDSWNNKKQKSIRIQAIRAGYLDWINRLKKLLKSRWSSKTFQNEIVKVLKMLIFLKKSNYKTVPLFFIQGKADEQINEYKKMVLLIILHQKNCS